LIIAFFSGRLYNLSMNSENMVKLLRAKLNEISIPGEIAAIYVYGSILKGRLRKDSDVDIAILPCYDIDDLEKLELVSIIEGYFTAFLKDIGLDREVSILDMRGRYVSVQLLYKVITEGILLYEDDPSQRFEFENTVKREYFDFKPYLTYLRKRKYGDILQKA